MKLLFLSATCLSSLIHFKISAHGASSYPQARQWLCSGGAAPNKNVWWGGGNGPNICKPALTGDGINTVITDWAGVSQGAAGGYASGSAEFESEYRTNPRAKHVQVMPNGLNAKICSADDTKYAALNSPLWTEDQGGYPNPGLDAVYPTEMKNGKTEFTYTVTAPHKTYSKGYIDSYITKDGTDFSKEITWNDLESFPFCHYVPENTNTPLQSRNMNNVEKFNCDIPTEKLGKHVIFQIWQRDDSLEAFYGCSDVVLASAGGSDDGGQTTESPTTESSRVTTEGTTEGTTASTTEAIPICLVSPDAASSLVDLSLPGNHLKYNGHCISHDNADGKMRLSVNVNENVNEHQSNCDGNDGDHWQIKNEHQIQLNSDSNLCWSISDLGSSSAAKKLFKTRHSLETRFCDHNKLGQIFIFEDGMIKSFVDETYCVGVAENEVELSVLPCKNLSGKVHYFGID